MPCRVLQFGVKYFVGTAGAMVLVLALQANLPALRDWRLLYGAPCTRTAQSSGSRYFMTSSLVSVHSALPHCGKDACNRVAVQHLYRVAAAGDDCAVAVLRRVLHRRGGALREGENGAHAAAV